MKIIAVDPGLDDTGWAVFDYDLFLHLGATPQAALLALLESGTIHTSPKDDIVTRIRDLCHHLNTTAHTHRCEWGILELPAYHGDYAGKQRSRKSLNSLYIAIGAIINTLSRIMDLETQNASRSPKAERLASLILCHNSTPNADPLPQGPRGGKREDELDAIHLGWWAIIGGNCHFPWKHKGSTP